MGKLARRITDGRTTGVRIRSVVFDECESFLFYFPAENGLADGSAAAVFLYKRADL
ncbi:hypothetical protein [Delftia tsuruhatensis]|uniref:hypothetical protein n=1 Tax=Delftia tsuruhatensis TaxID=180282 RepID=UPI002260BB54|nr:hypothetical protein [Delftia tsuruhatensis]MCX7505477.1 hypothetical protein [Delftia tsuruhatensis]